MGKRQRKLKSPEDLVEYGRTNRTKIEVVSTDDEVEKSLQFHGHLRTEGVTAQAIDSNKEGKEGKTKRRRSKEDAVVVEVPEDPVANGLDAENGLTSQELFPSDTFEEKQEDVKAIDISINAFEWKSGEKSENAVLRKLLRGPRYFDPPDTTWGACRNCGEDDHKTNNCPSEKPRKPCYVCGSYDHIAKRCNQGLDCFICQSKGHRARDCPNKHKGSMACLKCGDVGHNMFSCRNKYFSEDLKEIECYVCGKFGHLCCADYSDPGPGEFSCYRCGLPGHTGLACKGYNSEAVTVARDGSCFKCGLQGHFSRECTSSKKAGKKVSEPSTPKQQYPWGKKYAKDIKSAPVNPGKIRKKNPIVREFVSSGKSKHRGGWLTEHPGDWYSGKSKHNDRWVSLQSGGTSRGCKKNPRFPESPHDRRSLIATSSGHRAISTPGSSQSRHKYGSSNPPC